MKKKYIFMCIIVYPIDVALENLPNSSPHTGAGEWNMPENFLMFPRGFLSHEEAFSMNQAPKQCPSLAS